MKEVSDGVTLSKMVVGREQAKNTPASLSFCFVQQRDAERSPGIMWLRERTSKVQLSDDS